VVPRTVPRVAPRTVPRVAPRVVVATGRLEAARCHNHASVTRSCSGYALLLSLIAWRKLMRGPVRKMEFE